MLSTGVGWCEGHPPNKESGKWATTPPYIANQCRYLMAYPNIEPHLSLLHLKVKQKNLIISNAKFEEFCALNHVVQACNASPQLDLETRLYRVEGCVHFETDGRFSRVACGGPCGGFQSHLATCNITLHRIVTYYSTVTAPAGDYSTDRTHSRDRFLFPSPCQRIARNPDCGSIW